MQKVECSSRTKFFTCFRQVRVMCSRMILWSQPDFAAKALHVKFWIISARSKSKVDKVTASKQVSLEIGEKQEVHMACFMVHHMVHHIRL